MVEKNPRRRRKFISLEKNFMTDSTTTTMSSKKERKKSK